MMMPQQAYFERLIDPQKHAARTRKNMQLAPAKASGSLGRAHRFSEDPLDLESTRCVGQLHFFERAFSDPWQGSCDRFVPDQ